MKEVKEKILSDAIKTCIDLDYELIRMKRLAVCFGTSSLILAMILIWVLANG